LDCAVQVTAGKAGMMLALAPRCRKSLIRGMSAPRSDSVRPATLMTAVRRISECLPCRAKHFLGPLRVAVPQLVDGFGHLGQAHLMRLKTLSDPLQERNRQLAT